MKGELFPEELDERCVCLWICLTGEGPSFGAEAGEGVLQRHVRACLSPGKPGFVHKVPDREQGSNTVLWIYKKPVPCTGWMVTKGLLRLNASVGSSAQSRLRTVESPQQVDSVLRYLSLKASLLVNLTEVTVWVLWRQVSRSAGFYSREVRNSKNNKKRTL